ncbi:MAG: hypothetical protein DRN78_05725, partial [Thermoproteota archaeon]
LELRSTDAEQVRLLGYNIFRPFTYLVSRIVEEAKPREVGGTEKIPGYALIFIDSRDAVSSRRYLLVQGGGGYIPRLRATTFYLLPETEEEVEVATGAEGELPAPTEEIEEGEISKMAEEVEAVAIANTNPSSNDKQSRADELIKEISEELSELEKEIL